MKKRMELFETILKELTFIYLEIKKVNQEIEKISSTFLTNYYAENNEIIQEEINQLKGNIEQIKQYNYQTTEEINQWYLFINNQTETIKLSFPLKLYMKRRNLQKKITKVNKLINQLAIQNRLVKEKLTKKERMIEGTILKQIKETGIYKKYEELVKKKEEYISDLEYLLPTIPSLPPKIDLNYFEMEPTEATGPPVSIE